jgi:hypothetical protein
VRESSSVSRRSQKCSTLEVRRRRNTVPSVGSKELRVLSVHCNYNVCSCKSLERINPVTNPNPRRVISHTTTQTWYMWQYVEHLKFPRTRVHELNGANSLRHPLTHFSFSISFVYIISLATASNGWRSRSSGFPKCALLLPQQIVNLAIQNSYFLKKTYCRLSTLTQ